MRISKERIEEILGGFTSKKIIVLGDVMLDRYLWGKVRRISPEAPVPIVHVTKESGNLGGAANVAGNISAMGAKVSIIGILGEDTFGKEFIKLAQQFSIDTSGLLIDANRQTTVKTRIIAHQQHVVRIDREKIERISKELEDLVLEKLKELLPNADALIIEDYNKGLLTKRLIRKSIALAKRYGKIITVDPKFDNFFDYKGVTLFKPNRREIASGLGITIETEAKMKEAGRKLSKILDCEALLVTRGEEGMTLFYRDGKIEHLETVAKEVYDVSGAGDTVISAVTLALACGANFYESAYIANHATAVAISEVGAFPVSLKELKECF